MGIQLEGWIPTPPSVSAKVDKILYGSQQAVEFSDLKLKDTGKGKLSLPFKASIKVSGEELFAKEAQNGPDCTSHAARNAWDITRAVDIDLGEAEEWVARGATELIYGMRAHSGAGMNVGRAVKFLHEIGNLIRKDWGIIDLSKYNFGLGDDWGRGGTPSKIQQEAAKFPAMHFYRINSIEEARDALANGYGVLCGSRFGTDGKRDKNGVVRRNKSWNHAMAWGGCDDRNGELLFLILQSWGLFGSGGQPDWGQLPLGGFLIHETDADWMIRSGEAWALGKVKGLPARNLPDYGASSFL